MPYGAVFLCLHTTQELANFRERAGAHATLDPVGALALARAVPATASVLAIILPVAARIARSVANRWLPQAVPFIADGGAHFAAIVVRLQRRADGVDAAVEVYDVVPLFNSVVVNLTWLLQQAGVRTVRPPVYFHRALQVR